MSDCKHEHFTATVEVHRLSSDGGATIRNYMAQVSVRCVACGLPFHFLGTDTGVSFVRPSVDIPATTLHAPIAPGERLIEDVPTSLKYELA